MTTHLYSASDLASVVLEISTRRFFRRAISHSRQWPDQHLQDKLLNTLKKPYKNQVNLLPIHLGITPTTNIQNYIGQINL